MYTVIDGCRQVWAALAVALSIVQPFTEIDTLSTSKTFSAFLFLKTAFSEKRHPAPMVIVNHREFRNFRLSLGSV